VNPSRNSAKENLTTGFGISGICEVIMSILYAGNTLLNMYRYWSRTGITAK
jgi:hypothetical protein